MRALEFDRYCLFYLPVEIRKKASRHMATPPGWLKEFADAAALLLMPADVLAPIGCHYCQVGQAWEISLFVSRTEIVGGECDGESRNSKFILDVPALMQLFERVPTVTWQAQSHGDEDELGPHVALAGRFAGRNVSLRVLAHPPQRFAPGRQAVVYTNTVEDCW